MKFQLHLHQHHPVIKNHVVFGQNILPPDRLVISNYTAAPYHASSVKENLTQQISNPVKWLDSIEYLLEKNEHDFQCIGPSQVLSKFTENMRKVFLRS